VSDQPYKTLLKPAKTTLIVQKSRFMGCAAPVASQDQALRYLQDIKTSYPDATHHCYAYILLSNSGIMRYSDDGEPSGTAGIPILEVLKMRSLVNACIVVVRYFGGTLLGAGGLARAYTKSSTMALDAARTVMMEPSLRVSAHLPYPIWDLAQRRLADMPVIVEQINYSTDVQITLVLRKRDESLVESRLYQLSEGRVKMFIQEALHYAWQASQDKA
jgi:uncharacterized YigZ family protein